MHHPCTYEHLLLDLALRHRLGEDPGTGDCGGGNAVGNAVNAVNGAWIGNAVVGGHEPMGNAVLKTWWIAGQITGTRLLEMRSMARQMAGTRVPSTPAHIHRAPTHVESATQHGTQQGAAE